ncbi:MAG: restriction endonuclease [Epulopiscium sp.]|nr:restriction endonuclease [Candidatus Epulonipiscium sp.]
MEDRQLEMVVDEGEEVKVKNWLNDRMIKFKDLVESEGGVSNMKFDVVIGNPPYNKKAIGASTSDDPIYHVFMQESYKLADKVILVTPGRFLFNAGKTPKAWNMKMLNDKHLKVPYFEYDSKKVFANILIPGGIAITYRDKNQDYGKIETFIPHKELRNILIKVSNLKQDSLKKIIYNQSRFDLNALYNDYPDYKNIIGNNGRDKRLRQIIMERLDIFTIKQKRQDDIKILGLIERERVYRYIPKKYIEYVDWLNKYKVFVPAANGSGAIGEVDSTPLIGAPVLGLPGEGITQTFIGIGLFSSEEEAGNLLKYIKTKFARTMLGVLKVTQGNNPDTWEKVPIQDFTSDSDIDWTKSIAEIDQQLYKKYGLDEEEINFIESNVKEME